MRKHNGIKIKSNLISPRQAFNRNVRREKERAMKALQWHLNTHLKKVNESFEFHNKEWSRFVEVWNKNPQKYSALRATDFESFLDDYFKKIYNEKNKFEKFIQACYDVLRPIINRFWIRYNKPEQDTKNGVHQDTTKQQEAPHQEV